MNSESVVLRCRAIGGCIDMAIGNSCLRFAAEQHPYFWDGQRPPSVPNIIITDEAMFAKEICHAINAEGEDGSTLLTRMLDEAIRKAVEGGCEGVEIPGETT